MTSPPDSVQLLQFTKENMTILLQFMFRSFTIYRKYQRIPYMRLFCVSEDDLETGGSGAGRQYPAAPGNRMESFNQLLHTLSGSLVDIVVYLAIGLVTVIGIVKCVLPVRRSAASLRRAARVLEKSPVQENGHAVWENELFMGRQMSDAWRRFLQNWTQLDARGMTCDVKGFINDDTAIYAQGNVPLSEMVPGLLTSLGILGTFLGLMRGLGGLHIEDAGRMMEEIPTLVGGMSFAFATSIAGVSCSLLFQLLNRVTMGSAVNALEGFHTAFSEYAMQTPLTAETRAVCQREDQALFLRRAADDLSDTMAERMSGAIERSFVPLAQQMNSFIAGQTQSQLEGLNVITQHFVASMNQQLGGQFMQLGQTLAEVNRSQQASFSAVDRSMATADQVIAGLAQVQQMTAEITARFDAYVQRLNDSTAQTDAFTRTAGEVLGQMGRSARMQSENLQEIQAQQAGLRDALQDYAIRSKQSLKTIVDRAEDQDRQNADIARQMRESGDLLRTSYAKLVENVSVSLTEALGSLEKNMAALTKALEEQTDDLKNAGASAADARVISVLSDLSQTAARIEAILRPEGSGAA